MNSINQKARSIASRYLAIHLDTINPALFQRSMPAIPTVLPAQAVICSVPAHMQRRRHLERERERCRGSRGDGQACIEGVCILSVDQANAADRERVESNPRLDCSELQKRTRR
eukprot:2645692-Rhodomonas_salina.4